MSTAIAGLQT